MRLCPSARVVSKSVVVRPGSGSSRAAFSSSSPAEIVGPSVNQRIKVRQTYLNEEWHERVVMEIELHLVTERLPGCIGEHVRSQHLIDNVERSHNGKFLIHFRSVRRQVC
jgi:hypothetical protein